MRRLNLLNFPKIHCEHLGGYIHCYRCFASSSNKPLLQWPNKGLSVVPELAKLEGHWKNVAMSRGEEDHSRLSKYILSMIPYPSGRLHMGHMRVYTISDALARYYRLNAYNVIHPIGWDAFGLPAENAARDANVDPEHWTERNIAEMKEQFLRTGIIFDWDREISTCSTDYYRWSQWIFCQLYKSGMVRRALAEVNWDPIDCTVLAAEQIDSEGRSWRSGAVAEKRKLKHWMIETPKYAKRMHDGLQKLGKWDEVAAIQAEWIGKCDVWRFLLPLKSKDGKLLDETLDLRISEPHNLANANVIFVHPGHPLIAHPDSGKDGNYVLDVTALNVVTGKDMHIICVRQDPGTDLPATAYVQYARLSHPESTFDAKTAESFGLNLEVSNLDLSDNDVIEIAAFGKYGGYQTSGRLLDWAVSRQRSWGTPIPVLLGEDGRSAMIIPEEELPVIPANRRNRAKIKCDRLPGGYGFWETDTLDTFFDSSWYYLRYLDSKNETRIVDPKMAIKMPVDVYIGGIEHAAVHIFYARFMSYFLHDIGVSPVLEPFDRLLPQGVVNGRTYRRADNHKYLRANDVEQTADGFIDKSDGGRVEARYEKMSKSKNNGVDPLDVLNLYGVDLTRLQLLNEAAPREPINWGEKDLVGLTRWLERVARLVNDYVTQRLGAVQRSAKPLFTNEERIRKIYNFHVRNVSMVLEVLHLHNTAIDHLKAFSNTLKKLDKELYGRSKQFERCITALVVMLQLFTPHLAAEMWSAICTVPAFDRTIAQRDKDISSQRWPEVDPDATVDFIINVCGMSCGRVEVPRKAIEHLSEKEALELAVTKVHTIFFTKLASLGYSPKTCTMGGRKGFYVELTVHFDDSLKQSELKKVLNETRKKRLKAKKAIQAAL